MIDEPLNNQDLPQTTASIIPVTVVTREFELEGDLHCPQIGKRKRLLTNLLNSSDRRYLVLTKVRVHARCDDKATATQHEMIHVSMSAIEYIQPHIRP